MIEIKYMGIDAVERYHDNRKHVIISVTSPGSRIARLSRSAMRRDTLHMQFWDVKRYVCKECSPPFWTACKEIDKHIVLSPMLPVQAQEIADFVKKWVHIVDLIVVHCEMGVSRSVGIACAIADWLDHPSRASMFERNAGNGHVRTLVYNALTNGASKPEGA